MRLFEEALDFAAYCHRGASRKNSRLPYILHPMEAAVIAASITDDEEVISAALLHDTAEDAGISIAELEERFGPRVASLVASETENKRRDLPSGETWKIRKEESLEELKNAEDPGVKILWLADKLSNMRGLCAAWKKSGDAFWQHFNMKDPKEQYWYYSSIADILSELDQTDAYQEYIRLMNTVFSNVISEQKEGQHE